MLNHCKLDRRLPKQPGIGSAYPCCSHIVGTRIQSMLTCQMRLAHELTWSMHSWILTTDSSICFYITRSERKCKCAACCKGLSQQLQGCTCILGLSNKGVCTLKSVCGYCIAKTALAVSDMFYFLAHSKLIMELKCVGYDQ